MKNSNLKSWQPGVSGNPKGRPKGSRNIKKVIQNMLDDKDSYKKLSLLAPRGTETPLEAIICTLMVKAMRGDIRATDVLLRYSVDRDTAADDEGGFFSPGNNQLIIKVVDSQGKQIDNKPETIIKEGQLPGYEDPETALTVS